MNVRVDRQCLMYTVDRYQLHTENTHLATKHCGNCLGVVLRTQLNDHKTLKGLRRRLYCYYNRRQIGMSQKGSLHTPCFKLLQQTSWISVKGEKSLFQSIPLTVVTQAQIECHLPLHNFLR